LRCRSAIKGSWTGVCFRLLWIFCTFLGAFYAFFLSRVKLSNCARDIPSVGREILLRLQAVSLVPACLIKMGAIVTSAGEAPVRSTNCERSSSWLPLLSAMIAKYHRNRGQELGWWSCIRKNHSLGQKCTRFVKFIKVTERIPQGTVWSVTPLRLNLIGSYQTCGPIYKAQNHSTSEFAGQLSKASFGDSVRRHHLLNLQLFLRVLKNCLPILRQPESHYVL
jgi:hypothetical protein